MSAAATKQPMLSCLLPAQVLVQTVHGDSAPDAEPHPAEAACLTSAGPARRAEFLRGRACARSLLARLGMGEHPVRRSADGAPVWPAGIVGSISHTAGCCAAAVAWRTDVAALGIDVDTRESLPADLLPLVCVREELHGPAPLPRGSVDPGKLIFSCKESVYKCYRCLYGDFVDFVDVALTIDLARREFRARALRPVIGLAAVCRQLAGRFTWDDQYLYSTACLTARMERT